MDKEYISIKEFAEKVGVSVQAIYKRVNNETDKIQPYLVKVKNKVRIDSKALTALYSDEDLNQELNQVEKVEKSYKLTGEYNQESYYKVLDTLNEQINAYRKEIKTKNKQIADLLELMKNNNQVLSQQQELNLMDKRKILQLESAEDKKKRTFFSWLKNNK